MDKKKFFIPGAPPPIGPYSPALLVNDTLYISGQVPINIESGNLITENIELATHQVLRNIKALLAEADMTLENVVKCTIFMTDLNEFQKMNAVYASYFEGVAPARETVEISRLPMDATIEISCIAIK
jgi:2-iminobutanoate/2-iminopropanoate deaminase